MKPSTKSCVLLVMVACGLTKSINFAWAAQSDHSTQLNHPRANADLISPTTFRMLVQSRPHTILFVDVRTAPPTVSDSNFFSQFVQIRYKNLDTAQLNTQFPMQVGNALAAKELTIGAMIVLICDDGANSAEAAQWLAWVGHMNAVSVQGGVRDMVLAKQ